LKYLTKQYSCLQIICLFTFVRNIFYHLESTMSLNHVQVLRRNGSRCRDRRRSRSTRSPSSNAGRPRLNRRPGSAGRSGFKTKSLSTWEKGWTTKTTRYFFFLFANIWLGNTMRVDGVESFKEQQKRQGISFVNIW